MAHNMATNHLLEVPLNKSKMAKVVEGGPQILRVVLAFGERSMKLFFGKFVVVSQQ